MNFIKQNWNKLFISLFSILAVTFAFTFIFDIKGKELIDDSFSQAVIVFGSAKALNAVISLAQGTEIDLPFLTIAVGQILDPINDLIEQFSLVMLASMTSLGIQKILMNFVTSGFYNILLTSFVLILNLWLFIRFSKDEKFRLLFFKVTIILIFLRFAVPSMSYVNELAYNSIVNYVNELAYNSIVKPEYNIEKLNKSIIGVKDKVTDVMNNTTRKQEDKSILTKFTEKLDSEYYSEKVDAYKKAVEHSSEFIVALIIAFVFQTIFLPIIFLFSLYHLIRGIFNVGK